MSILYLLIAISFCHNKLNSILDYACSAQLEMVKVQNRGNIGILTLSSLKPEALLFNIREGTKWRYFLSHLS